MYTLEEMKKLFNIANNRFLNSDIALIETDVSEQCICGALKYHLENELKLIKLNGYYVDVEYNRNCGKIKTIIDGNYQIINIKCDVIIHSRGRTNKQDNLIAIEMKKSYQNEIEKENDRNRLIALTKPTSTDEVWHWEGNAFPKHVCGYVLGIYYEVDKDNRLISIEYYSNGKLIEKYNTKFESIGKKRRIPNVS